MIILTGASSFLGRNFLSEFNNKKNIICLVRKRVAGLVTKQAVVDFYEKKSLEKFINKGDTIIHILGITSGSKKELFSVNYEITKNLVDIAKKKKIAKFIFISTAIVSMKEKGYYGESKLAAENYIKRGGLRFIILRPSIIYGKGEKKFLGKIIKLTRDFEVAPIIGSGMYKIKPVYVKDVAKIIKKSITLKKNKDTYYLAGPEQISFNEICKIISGVAKKDIYVIHLPIPFLKILSKFITMFNKSFPSTEQIERITKHENYNIKNTEKDFNIKFTNFNRGIRETLNE